MQIVCICVCASLRAAVTTTLSVSRGFPRSAFDHGKEPAAIEIVYSEMCFDVQTFALEIDASTLLKKLWNLHCRNCVQNACQGMYKMYVYEGFCATEHNDTNRH